MEGKKAFAIGGGELVRSGLLSAVASKRKRERSVSFTI